jgi:hypothetical protein
MALWRRRADENSALTRNPLGTVKRIELGGLRERLV